MPPLRYITPCFHPSPPALSQDYPLRYICHYTPLSRLDTDHLGDRSGFRICEIGDDGAELAFGRAARSEADGIFRTSMAFRRWRTWFFDYRNRHWSFHAHVTAMTCSSRSASGVESICRRFGVANPS
jgi:hypothetical protein